MKFSTVLLIKPSCQLKTQNMIALYVIIGIILLVLLLGLIISNDMNYEKSITINTTIDVVWKNVNSLDALDKWSPWNDKDPNMKKILTGTDGTVGACQSWVSSAKGVGEGSQTITKLDGPNLLETKLVFLKPFKSTADAYVKLSKEGNSTIAIWGFKSKMPYPMNIMKLFMNFKKEMDKEFGSGLNKLKKLCEE